MNLPKHPTLEDTQGYFERFYWNQRTYGHVVRQANKIVAFFPDKPVDGIFRADVARFKAELEKVYAPLTVRNILQVGGVWYQWMQDNGIVEYDINPFRQLTARPRYGPRGPYNKQKETPSD
jgi:hypothetical protein